LQEKNVLCPATRPFSAGFKSADSTAYLLDMIGVLQLCKRPPCFHIDSSIYATPCSRYFDRRAEGSDMPVMSLMDRAKKEKTMITRRNKSKDVYMENWYLNPV